MRLLRKKKFGGLGSGRSQFWTNHKYWMCHVVSAPAADKPFAVDISNRNDVT